MSQNDGDSDYEGIYIGDNMPNVLVVMVCFNGRYENSDTHLSKFQEYFKQELNN